MKPHLSQMYRSLLSIALYGLSLFLVAIPRLQVFHQELNRLTLTITGNDSRAVKITWGKESQTFTAEQVAAGINLAAAFEDMSVKTTSTNCGTSTTCNTCVGR